LYFFCLLRRYGEEADFISVPVLLMIAHIYCEPLGHRIPDARIGDLGTDFKSVPLPSPRSGAPAKTTV